MDREALLARWREEALAAPVQRELFEPDGRLLNFHARVVRRPLVEVYHRIQRLGSRADDLWPLPSLPMRNEGRLSVGVRSGHGKSSYECVAVEAPARVEWRFTMELMHGRHAYSTHAAGDGTYVEHLINGGLSGSMAEHWTTSIGPFHDWIIERLLERLEQPPVPWIEPSVGELVR
jgi:hypothetical protein